MHPKAMQAMMRDPRKLMRFQMTGQVPSVSKAPSTPLRELIEVIPARVRTQIKGVKLHPELGFNCATQFQNLEQLYRWLGGHSELVGNQRMPYMSWRIAAFRSPITLSKLLEHCVSAPEIEVLQRYIPKRHH